VTSHRMHELARYCAPTRGAADAIATTARALGFDVEVRGGGAAGWIVIVERVAPAPRRGANET